MTLRNPTPEELEEIKSKKNKTANVIPKKIESEHKEVSTDVESEWDILKGSRVKKKKSKWEPDPVEYILPSLGKTLKSTDSVTPDGGIYVRRLGTDEEVLISKIRDVESFNNVTNEIFKKTIQSDVDIDNIAVIDKIHLLTFIVGISFSDRISIKQSCAKLCEICKNDKDGKIEVTTSVVKDLVRDYIPKDTQSPFEFKLKTYEGKADVTLWVNYPTVKNEQLFYKDEVNPTDVIHSLVEDFEAVDAEGNEIDEKELAEMLKWLNREDKQFFSEKIGEFSNYGNRFLFSSFECSEKKCGMKNKTVEASIENVMTSLLESIGK